MPIIAESDNDGELMAPGSNARKPNPYRAILKREFPEPFIALLAFVLGLWLWDHYVGASEEYAPGTEDLALIRIDRDLRLADAMEKDPEWLRWMMGVASPGEAHANARRSLEKLAAGKGLGFEGLEAFAVVEAVGANADVGQVVMEVTGGPAVVDHGMVEAELASHQGTWWTAKLLEAHEEEAGWIGSWRQVYERENSALRKRTLMARSVPWLAVLLGAFFVPQALSALRKGWRAKPKGYVGAWSLPMGLTVFFCATLAWIGFTSVLEIGMSSASGVHPVVWIFLDSAARVLPAFIALAWLFQRPHHVMRAFGWSRRLNLPVVLGALCLLSMIDFPLRWWLGRELPVEPGGGLSAMEAGPWGLGFAIVSACLLGPFIEELLYRGVLFQSFWNRFGTVVGAMLSTVMFSLLHIYDGYGFASVAFFGFIAALLYAGTGSIPTVVLLHVIYNSLIKLPEWFVYHAPLG